MMLLLKPFDRWTPIPINGNIIKKINQTLIHYPRIKLDRMLINTAAFDHVAHRRRWHRYQLENVIIH